VKKHLVLLASDDAEGITSIQVAPDEIPFRLSLAGTTLRGHLAARHPTGARVTVEFVRSAPVCLNSDVRLYYDIAENGGLREILGVPQLTHVTARQARPGLSYHYRLSHWIAAPSVMRFIPPPYVDGLAMREPIRASAAN
jgi:hypothetical protein